ncbi:MAG: type III-B CRISPR module RAMP protein Cmr6 [Candidatus Competibacter denitrificans]
MGIAAVPQYLGHDFTGAPPGHRFGLYFPYWQPDTWQADDKQKAVALKQVISMDSCCQRQLDALRIRQATLAEQGGAMMFTLEAISSAPFMTGTGMEHPLENGFAFLNPYGLPYLPGSGVKGVLRRAAENLVSGEYGDARGWTQEAISSLFGKETASGDAETARNRGAVQFWDVIPKLASNTLCVEIMTPHYGDYYQGASTPHDSGQPNPIPFLAIPPRSAFTFYIQCNPTLVPKTLHDCWQLLLEIAFQHAFDWLGFGAKTAVGYGAMDRDLEQEAKKRHEAEQREHKAREASLTPGQKALAELERWFAEDREAKRKEPGGRIADRLNELLKEGLLWPAAEREGLAQLAEAIYGYLGWGDGKKKQDRKAKIQKLCEGEAS